MMSEGPVMAFKFHTQNDLRYIILSWELAKNYIYIFFFRFIPEATSVFC